MTIEIIAEIGVNHNGNYAQAAELVNNAAIAGCDTVKFQLWDSERVYPPERWAEMKRLELTRIDIVHLKQMVERAKMRFLCTPDDIHDARFLCGIGVERIKIGSSNITNLPLLQEIASWEIPVLLSTGAAMLDEVITATSIFGRYECPLTVMHCVSAYPAPFEQMNLTAITYWRQRGIKSGFSDHTLTNTNAALMALALGATVFEKHFTYDTEAGGPDHAMSFDFVQMRNYVQTLRYAEKALGDGVKIIQPCELRNRKEYERFVAKQKAALCVPE